MASSDAILARLLRLHPKKIDLSLGRVLALLARLGSPHESLPPVVHVAGTNGKGSSIAFLRAMLETAGYRAHVYTSPHLVNFNERIRLAGDLIEEVALAELLADCERVNAGDAITYFEITTAAAFKAFSETPADVVLLECGLGGRYDATTVVARPALTAITPLSMDHMQFLGGTLAKIAGEKAAIQKRNVVTVVGAQLEEARQVIEMEAEARGAILYCAGYEWRVHAEAGQFVYESRGGRRSLLPLPALPGPHQIGNAGLAIACLENLSDFAVDDEQIAVGLRAVEWPARVQRLQRGPLVDLLPDGWELWLDGGHNAAAGEMLAAVAAEWDARPLFIVFGMLDSKDPRAFLSPLTSRIRGLHAVTIPGEEASLAAVDAARAARKLGLPAVVADSVANALRGIISLKVPSARILICGSLYLAGHVLGENG